MELININQGRIFTSRELASWTNRNHNQVLKDIRREIDQLKKDPQMHCFIEGNFALV